MERISSFYSLEHLVTTLDEQGVPEEYMCPITQDFMRDPCIAEDGHTYERAAIEEWLGRHGTSPITREYISAEHLMPDATLRKMIDDFLSEKRQLLLSQREREKGRLAAPDPETDERPAVMQSQEDHHATHEEEEEDDDDDDDRHPYVSDGVKAERAPLMGLSTERGTTKGQQQQAGAKRMGSTRHPHTTKGVSSSRSLHAPEASIPLAHTGGSRREPSSSCWMCVLY